MSIKPTEITRFDGNAKNVDNLSGIGAAKAGWRQSTTMPRRHRT